MTPKNKINLSLVTFSIFIICSIIFIIYPLFSEIKKNSEDLIIQKSAIVSLEAKVENLEESQTLWLKIKPNLEKIDKLFINSEVPVEFIDFLEMASQDCDTPIKLFPSLPREAKGELWPFLTFQITLDNSFPKVLKFIEKLENSPYLIEIQNLNIRKLTEGELKSEEYEKFSLGGVKTSLSIKVYAK